MTLSNEKYKRVAPIPNHNKHRLDIMLIKEM